MDIHSPTGSAPARAQTQSVATGFEKLLRVFSVLTMVMTVPQAYTVWTAGNVAGVSVPSWSAYLVSACLWFVYGVRKRDKTIYVACVGWILLDAAIVLGVVVRG